MFSVMYSSTHHQNIWFTLFLENESLFFFSYNFFFRNIWLKSKLQKTMSKKKDVSPSGTAVGPEGDPNTQHPKFSIYLDDFWMDRKFSPGDSL